MAEAGNNRYILCWHLAKTRFHMMVLVKIQHYIMVNTVEYYQFILETNSIAEIIQYCKFPPRIKDSG